MKLIKRFGMLFSMLLLAVACSSGGDEAPEPVALATPMPSVEVQGAIVTITWAPVEHAASYTYEFFKNGSLSESKSVQIPSFSYKMEGETNYGFRVKATADDSGLYLDSSWSAQVTAQLNQLSTPVAKVVEGSVTNVAATLSWGQIANAAAYYYQLVEGGSVARAADLTGTQVELTGLKEGTTYKFRVKAVGSDSWIDSNYSNDVSFQTKKIVNLATPTELNGAGSGPVMILSWKAVDQAASYSYELYRGSESTALKAADVTAASVSIEGMEKGSYRFRVKAVGKKDDPYTKDSEFSEMSSFEFDPSKIDLGLPASEMDGVIRAFPGAEGGGMYTTGGRGGRVIHVTNLNDSGTGSLRAAINQSGKRIIVFDVAGTITLNSDLEIGYGDLTIAGQTAPGDGICIKGGTVQIKASNLIIRFVRFRMGDESSFASDGSDASWGRYYQDIILDHNSYSWSIDEVASFYANKNFTMQWCTIGEGLCNSKHSKKSHGYGGIWGGKNASFHHNLLIHNNSRNPRFCHPQVYGNQLSSHRGNVDYRNNVVYNWGDNSSYGGEDLHINMVGNYYKPGPASKQRKYFLDANGYYSSGSTQYKYPRLYLEDNYHAGSYATALNSNNWQGIYWHDQGDATKHAAGDAAGAKLSAPLPIKKNDATLCYTSTHKVADAFERVLENAGASLRRDAVDKRYIDDARNGKATCMSGSNGSKNGLIDSQNDAGGWPTLSATSEEINRAKTDTDGDHIPDYYELILGLDKSKNDASEKSLDPQGLYTNFEIYLHYLVKDITVRQTAGATYKGLQ